MKELTAIGPFFSNHLSALGKSRIIDRQSTAFAKNYIFSFMKAVASQFTNAPNARPM